jgi:DNA-3-methyladenine glycosylase II
MRIIDSDADLAEGLDWLKRRDRRLGRIIRESRPVALRRRRSGFDGLARIVVAQQVSVASAEAIWKRLEVALPERTAAGIAVVGNEVLRGVGLSAPKIRTLRAVSAACTGGLDLDALATLPGEEAHRRLTAVKGIGPWTADIYLLFCLGHADVFPVGDLALRNAVSEAFDHEPPIDVNALNDISGAWSPWRGAAAHLFWAYYRVRRNRKAVPV